jgi:WD40 repeat protein
MKHQQSWAMLLVMFIILGLAPASAQSAQLVLMHEGVVTWAGWSATEDLILTTSEDGMARIWNSANGELAETYVHDAPVRGGEWNPNDMAQFLTWTEDGAVRVWSFGMETALMTLTHEGVSGARWNEDGTQILTWGSDSDAVIWQVDDGKPIVILETGAPVRQADWSADEASVFTFSEDGAAEIWDAGTGERLRDDGAGGR